MTTPAEHPYAWLSSPQVMEFWDALEQVPRGPVVVFSHVQTQCTPPIVVVEYGGLAVGHLVQHIDGRWMLDPAFHDTYFADRVVPPMPLDALQALVRSGVPRVCRKRLSEQERGDACL